MSEISELFRKMFPFPARVGVLFSGGVDSSALLYLLVKALGPDHVFPLFARLAYCEGWEESSAQLVADNLGLALGVVDVNPLEIPEVASNSLSRCYHCKRAIIAALMRGAKDLELDFYCDGSTSADDPATRPGSAALKEAGVLSPLRILKLSREEIRRLAVLAGCSEGIVSGSCMATRFEENYPLDQEEIVRLRRLEERFRELGYAFVRLRVIAEGLAFETSPHDTLRAIENQYLLRTLAKASGYKNLDVNLNGYKGQV